MWKLNRKKRFHWMLCRSTWEFEGLILEYVENIRNYLKFPGISAKQEVLTHWFPLLRGSVCPGRRQKTVFFMEGTIFYGNTILTSGLDFKGRRLTGMEFRREEVGMRLWHFQGCRWICLTLCSEPGGLRLVVLRKDLQGEKNVTIHWLASYWLNYGEKNSVLNSALDFLQLR